GDEQDGTVAVARREAAERPFDLPGIPDLHRLEAPRREAPARYQANMKLDGPGSVVRGAGEREGAPGAVLQDDIDVLARDEVHAFARGQGEDQPHDVLGEGSHPLDPAGPAARDGDAPRREAGDAPDPAPDVLQRDREAHQRLPT